MGAIGKEKGEMLKELEAAELDMAANQVSATLAYFLPILKRL